MHKLKNVANLLKSWRNKRIRQSLCRPSSISEPRGQKRRVHFAWGTEWWAMLSCVLDLGRILGAMTVDAQGVETSIAKITDHLGIRLAGDG